MADIARDAQWQVWYRDTFDRECPRRVEVEGRGLVAGLFELWSRHLSETVRPDGRRGFSQFNLWWKQAASSVEITGDPDAMRRVREWVFGSEEVTGRRYVAGGEALLRRIAEVHARLVVAGETSEAILASAEVAVDRSDFEMRLEEARRGRV